MTMTVALSHLTLIATDTRVTTRHAGTLTTTDPGNKLGRTPAGLWYTGGGSGALLHPFAAAVRRMRHPTIDAVGPALAAESARVLPALQRDQPDVDFTRVDFMVMLGGEMAEFGHDGSQKTRGDACLLGKAFYAIGYPVGVSAALQDESLRGFEQALPSMASAWDVIRRVAAEFAHMASLTDSMSGELVMGLNYGDHDSILLRGEASEIAEWDDETIHRHMEAAPPMLPATFAPDGYLVGALSPTSEDREFSLSEARAGTINTGLEVPYPAPGLTVLYQVRLAGVSPEGVIGPVYRFDFERVSPNPDDENPPADDPPDGPPTTPADVVYADEEITVTWTSGDVLAYTQVMLLQTPGTPGYSDVVYTAAPGVEEYVFSHGGAPLGTFYARHARGGVFSAVLECGEH